MVQDHCTCSQLELPEECEMSDLVSLLVLLPTSYCCRSNAARSRSSFFLRRRALGNGIHWRELSVLLDVATSVIRLYFGVGHKILEHDYLRACLWQCNETAPM